MNQKTTFLFRRLYLTIILTISCFLSSLTSFSQQWDIIGNEAQIASASTSSSTIVVLNESGNLIPYVAYTENNIPRVKKRLTNGVWTQVGTDLGTSGSYTKIFTNSVGGLYVSYIDASASSKLAIKKYNSGNATWEPLNNDTNNLYVSTGSANSYSGISQYSGIFRCSMVFDSSNNPIVSFTDAGSVPYIRKFNGTSWTTLGTSTISSFAISTSLAIDSNNKLWVAYCNMSTATSTSGTIGLSSYDSNTDTWTAATIPTTIPGGTAGTTGSTGIRHIGLADRGAGSLCLVYFCIGNTNKATASLFDTSAGTFAYSATLASRDSPNISLIKDDSGNLYSSLIDYTSSTNVFPTRIRYLASGSSTWTELKNPAVSRGIEEPTSWPAIGVASGSTVPYVVYIKSNSANISTPIVRKYNSLAPSIASFTPTTLATGVAFTITGTNFTGATKVSFGGTDVASYTVDSATSISGTTGASITDGNVIVTTPSGTATATIPNSLSYSAPTKFLAGTAIATLNPTIKTSVTTSYAVSPALPGGLTLTAATGAISGTPTAGIAVASTPYTVTATNVYGNTTYTLNFSVVTAADVTWTGATNNNWSVGTNWSTNSVPNTGDYISIASGNPILDVDFTVAGTLVISGTGTLTVNPTKTLTITGAANFGGKSVTFKSDATGTAKLGTSNGTLTNASLVTIERYIPARRAFRFLTLPVTTTTTINANWQETNGTTAGLGTHITGASGSTNGFDNTTTNNPSLFTYDNASQTWSAVTNTNVNKINAGDPYRLMVRGDRTIDLATNTPTPTNTTLRGTGTLTIGNKLIPNLSTATDGYSFIGNPYQSAVNMQTVLSNASNLKQFYYVWDPTLGTRGAYVTRDLTNGTNSITSNVNNYLQPGQACFVQTIATGPTALSFSEANKYTTATNESVFRLADSKKTSSKLSFTLYDKNTLTAKGTAADGAVVVFSDDNNNEVDSSDAGKMTNLDENLAIKTDSKLLSIENRTSPTAKDVIQLDITKYRSSNYTLIVEGTNLDGVTAYLLDQYNKTTTEIPSTGSVSYNFAVDANNTDSSASNRFQINFATKSNVAGVSTEQFIMYPNPSIGGETTITIADSSKESVISILNLSGRLIYKVTVEAGVITYNLKPKSSLAPGIYFIKMEQDGKAVVKKLIVK